MSYRNKLYINGRWEEPALGGTFVTVNPATNQPITEVANGNKQANKVIG